MGLCYYSMGESACGRLYFFALMVALKSWVGYGVVVLRNQSRRFSNSCEFNMSPKATPPAHDQSTGGAASRLWATLPPLPTVETKR